MRAWSCKALYPTLLLLQACTYQPYVAPTQRSHEGFSYEDRSYQPHIHAIQFTRDEYQDVPPVLFIDAQEPIHLEFDALIPEDAEPERFEVNLISCDANWEPSGLLPLEYYNGFLPDRLDPDRRSSHARLPYVHYNYQIPAPGYNFTRSGNFLLKVSLFGHPDSVILSRRILVSEQSAVIQGRAMLATLVADRKRKQRVDFNVLLPGGLGALDPQQDISAVVLRDFVWQDAVEDLRPRFVEGQRLDFYVMQGDEFDGGSQYRRIDLTDPAFVKARIAGPLGGDSIPYFVLAKDRPNLPGKPPLHNDNNGGFVVGSRMPMDEDVEGEYVMARFSLQYPNPLQGARVYVSGGFCGWQLLPAHELAYDAMRSEYSGDILLKQGLYDYAYIVLHADGSRDARLIEGNFAETQNVYTVLVYAKAPGEPAARLLGLWQIPFP